MKYIRITGILLLLAFQNIPSVSAQGNANLDAIWEAVGGKNTWDATDFILFTSQGNQVSKQIASERKFLIDKSNGRCRFEGKTAEDENLVLLFNYKSKLLKKLYLNNNEVKDTKGIGATYLTLVLDQFAEDTNLLFLPTSFEPGSTATGTPSVKISNAEKTTILPITQTQLFDGSSFKGKIYINSSGRIIQAETSDDVYRISGYKDIGGGLYLPTVFKNDGNPTKSCLFSTLAAFTDMEEGKFSSL